MLDTPTPRHLTLAELEAALPLMLQSPRDNGTLDLIGAPAGGRAA